MMNSILLSKLNSITSNISKKLKTQAILTAIVVVSATLTASPAEAYPMNILMMDDRSVQRYTAPEMPNSIAMTIQRDNFEIVNLQGWKHGYYDGDIVAYARTFVGKVKYATAGTTPESGFDCSGFLAFLYSSSQNIELPHSADTQAAMGKRISAANAKPGDWVWWPNQHIGLYIGNGKMIDSPKPGHKIEEHEIWGNPVYIRFNG